MEATEQRSHVHAMWAGVAPRWAEYADDLDEHEGAVTARMLAAAAVEPGDRVLELACGPGGTGLAAAAAVGPGGEVVVSDVAPEMAAIAAERAGSRGLANVQPATLDIEDIDEPDAGYDVVLCRQGLMFAVQPERAAGEIRRVLRPGGRAAIATWGPKADNPWLGLVFDAVSAELDLPIPPRGIPGPFNLDDPGRLQALLASAGLAEVRVERLPAARRWPSVETWWAWTSALAGPLATVLAAVPHPTRTAIIERLRTAAAPFAGPAGIELPSVTLLASARRA